MTKSLLLTLAATAAISFSSATVHYTQVNDYISMQGTRCDLDLNGDDDFAIAEAGGMYVLSLSSTSFFAADVSNTPKAYNSGSGLGTYHWQCDTSQMTTFTSLPKYLAVKFNNGADTFYGWICIGHWGGTTAILSHAWEDVPNQPLNPGVGTPTGIETINAGTSFISSLTSAGITFMHCEQLDKVTVYGLDGRLLSEINSPTNGKAYTLPLNSSTPFFIAFYKEEKVVSARTILSY